MSYRLKVLLNTKLITLIAMRRRKFVGPVFFNVHGICACSYLLEKLKSVVCEVLF